MWVATLPKGVVALCRRRQVRIAGITLGSTTTFAPGLFFESTACVVYKCLFREAQACDSRPFTEAWYQTGNLINLLMFVAPNTKSTRSIWFNHVTAIIAESLPPFFHGGWYGFCSDRLGWLQEYNMMSDTCAVGLFPWKAWKGVILECWVVLILDRLFCFLNAPKTSQGLQRKP